MVNLGTEMNILDWKQGKCLGVHLDTHECFPINISSHYHIHFEGVVHKVDLSMEDYNLKDEFSVTNVRGVDVILGAQWIFSITT